MLSHALAFMGFTINILLPAPDAFQGAVLGCTLRFFGKTDKIIQLSPFSGVRGMTVFFLPVAVWQIEQKTFRGVKPW